MAGNKVPIVWEQTIVGYIENLNADMFHWYGKWIPAQEGRTREFLELLRQGETLWVKVGMEGKSVNWCISSEPADEIELTYIPVKDGS